MQTFWHRTATTDWLRLTKFFGKLFMINFALGLVTGIVQEFQFGMNWSGLQPLRRGHLRRAAGLRGAARLLPRVDLPRPVDLRLGPSCRRSCTWLTIWLVHLGTVFSAFFILAANSFMQNPVGYTFNPTTNRAEMTDFLAVLTNKVQLVTFPHVITSAPT
jgi:cytochrome d ubiquinol oxidase subunit I